MALGSGQALRFSVEPALRLDGPWLLIFQWAPGSYSTSRLFLPLPRVFVLVVIWVLSGGPCWPPPCPSRPLQGCAQPPFCISPCPLTQGRATEVWLGTRELMSQREPRSIDMRPPCPSEPSGHAPGHAPQPPVSVPQLCRPCGPPSLLSILFSSRPAGVSGFSVLLPLSKLEVTSWRPTGRMHSASS